MKKSKSSQSKKKQLPKLKKYYEGGYSTPQGTFDSNGIMVAGPMGLPTNSPIQPKGSTVGNIAAGVDSVKKDTRNFNSYPVYQKIINPDGTPTYWVASAKMSKKDFENSSKTGSNIQAIKGAAPTDEKTYIANKGTFNMFPDVQRREYGGIHKYKPGGRVVKDIAAGLYGVGEGVLDTVTFGATDKLTDMGYEALQKAGGSSEDEIREQNSIHGYSQAAGAVGGAFINPAATGNAIAQTGEGLGQGVSEGNKSKKEAQTAGMLLNTAGKIGGMAYGAAGSPMTAGMESQSSNFNDSNFGQNLNKYNQFAGQIGAFAKYGGMYKHGGMKHPHMPHFSSFPPAPSGMYGAQLAYGGEQPNAEVEGGPNSQEAITPSDGRMPQVFGGGGLEQVSENPYGKPTYMTTRDSNTHEQADSNGQTGVPVSLSPGTAISSNKTKNPMTNRPFLKDLLKITNKEKKHSDILRDKDSTPSDIKNARVVLPMLAKAKENLEKYMAAVVENREQAKLLKNGIIPSTDNEQAEPRGMSEQSEGEMAVERHGGMYENGGMNFMNQGLIKSSGMYENGGVNLMNQGLIKGFNSYEEGGISSDNGPGKRTVERSENKDYRIVTMPDGTTRVHRTVAGIRNNAPAPKDGKYDGKKHYEYTKEDEERDFGHDQLIGMKYGGIHIKPENKGKFTAYKERTGKTTAEALRSPNAHVRQMANFARNAAKWKHEMGGLHKYAEGDVTPPSNTPPPGFPGMEGSDGPDYSMIGDIASGISQMAGPIYGLATNKKPAPVNYVLPEVRYTDPTEALRSADIEYNASKKSLKDMTMGNVGSYLSNLGSVQTQNQLAKAKIKQAYDEYNSGIYNLNQASIADIKNKGIDATAADMANYRNLNTKYVTDLGASGANIYRDSKASKYDQDYLDFLEKEYPQAYTKYKASKKGK